MQERFIRVRRTARYHVIGDAATAKRVWIVLHGYGQLARYFLHKFEGLQKDLLIVAPEGLSRFYVDEAHRRVGATWMTREDREQEIQDYVEYLDLLASEILQNVPKDTGLGILGFSQGVATACRWAMLGSTKSEELVVWSGSLPLELDQDTLASEFAKIRVTVVQGSKDRIVPRTVAEDTAALLRLAGIQHKVATFDGGHELEPVLLRKVLVG